VRYAVGTAPVTGSTYLPYPLSKAARKTVLLVVRAVLLGTATRYIARHHNNLQWIGIWNLVFHNLGVTTTTMEGIMNLQIMKEWRS
jgi:hypothetical protein